MRDGTRSGGLVAVRTTVAAALAAVALAACGTAAPLGHGPRPRTLLTSHRLGPPGGSPAEARAVGRRMLASLILPAGTKSIAHRSSPPRAELIGGQNVIDVSRFYWLPVRLDRAMTFLQAHVPAGTTQSGTASGSGPGSSGSFEAVQYTLKVTPPGIESFNMLLATLAPGSHGGTVLRADAEVMWYPPRSAAEYLRPGAYRSVRITATFYYGTLGAKVHTITRMFTSRAVIARLVGAINGLHSFAPVSGSCPAILPSFRIAFTPKPGHRQAAAIVSPDGCRADAITVAGRPQPALEDGGSLKVLAVVGPILGVHRHYW